jgi:hypothetical protein
MDSQVSIFVVLAELGQFPSILTSYFFREVLMPQVVQPGAVFRDGGGVDWEMEREKKEAIYFISPLIKSILLSSSHFALPMWLKAIFPSGDNINVAGMPRVLKMAGGMPRIV